MSVVVVVVVVVVAVVVDAVVVVVGVVVVAVVVDVVVVVVGVVVVITMRKRIQLNFKDKIFEPLSNSFNFPFTFQSKSLHLVGCVNLI